VINLAIMTWSGHRMADRSDLYRTRPSFYLKCQTHQLAFLRHSLDQITIVVPKNPEEPANFRSFLASIPNCIGKTKLVVYETENDRVSYGAFERMFESIGQDFDYHIFLEDDYLFVKDDFDSMMLALLSEHHCDYLASVVFPDGRPFYRKPVAYVSNGLIRSEAIAAEIAARKHPGYQALPAVQADFSHAFNDSSMSICDMGSKFRMPFRQQDGKNMDNIVWFYRAAGDEIIVPIQLYLDPERYRLPRFPKDWPNWRPCFFNPGKPYFL